MQGGKWAVGSGLWEVGSGFTNHPYLGSGSFDTVERGSYSTQMEVIKKPHSDTCDDVLAVFLKEAMLEHKSSIFARVCYILNNRTMVKILLEYC